MRSSSVGVVLLLALLSSSCGSDPAPSADPSVGSSAATSPSASDASSPADGPASDQPSGGSGSDAGTFAGFEPATGPEITGLISAINAPAGWNDQPLQDSAGGNTVGPNGDTTYNLQILDAPVIGAPDDLAEQVKDGKKFSNFGDDIQRLPDVDVAGVTGYHLAGPDVIFGTHLDQLGFIVENTQVLVKITTPADAAQADRDQLIGAIMASYRTT